MDMTIRIIANLGPNGELGYQGKTIYNNSLDFQLFKLVTCVDRAVVIAGRKTAESMKHVPSNGRDFRYVSYSQTTSIGRHKQWKHIDDLEIFLNSDKTHIEEQVYIIGGARLFEEAQQFAEEAILFNDDTFSYSPCDTWWNPSEYFTRENILFKVGSLTATRWVRRNSI